MSHHMDIFDGTIRHHQATFIIKILPILRRALDGLPDEHPVCRVSSLNHQLHRRLRHRIAFKYSKGFIGPEDFSAEKAPAEAPRVTEPLSFLQERFASLQLLFLQS